MITRSDRLCYNPVSDEDKPMINEYVEIVKYYDNLLISGYFDFEALSKTLNLKQRISAIVSTVGVICVVEEEGEYASRTGSCSYV